MINNQITADSVEAALFKAGKPLMYFRSPMQIGPATNSSWPEALRTHLDTIDVDEENREIRTILENKPPAWPPLRPREISDLDTVLDWFIDLGAYCQERQIWHVMQTVEMTILRHPVTDRPIYKNARIARILGTSERTARRWFVDGVNRIVIQQNARLSGELGAGQAYLKKIFSTGTKKELA
jgi:hypothetical protein